MPAHNAYSKHLGHKNSCHGKSDSRDDVCERGFCKAHYHISSVQTLTRVCVRDTNRTLSSNDLSCNDLQGAVEFETFSQVLSYRAYR